MPKILLLWYGAFTDNGTIGDLLAVRGVARYLAARDFDLDWASYAEFAGVPARRVDWREVSPADYDPCIFVCGPIIKNHPHLRALFERFRDNTLIGAGVSLFPEGHANHYQPFDHVLARDGNEARFGDLAVAAPRPTFLRDDDEAARGVVVGVSLRGRQTEYGAELCESDAADAAIGRVAEQLIDERSGRVVTIENHLARARVDPDDIERQYATADLVLTTRLHGALLAARHHVPFVAIDQIVGGGKVRGLLRDCGWPHVYGIESLTPDRLLQSSRALLDGDATAQLERVEVTLRARADALLQQLAALLSESC
ncbi:MAG: polysaccharide pyruvyl transferase family protein [Acidobacteriota bacterium]|jgi:hypothetical protein